MPVTGPDLNAARERGLEVGAKLLEELIEKEQLWDVTDTKFDGYRFLPGARKRWEAAKIKFVEAVADLFEEDASNSF